MIEQRDIITQKDLTQTFKENVVESILSGVSDKDNPAIIYGKTYRGQDAKTVAFTNENALPQEDLGRMIELKNSINNKLAEKQSTLISAADVHDLLIDVMRKLCVVRRYRSSWYHQKEGALNLVGTKEGKALFAPSLTSSLGVYTKQSNEPVKGWERSGATIHPSFPDVRFRHDDQILLSDINAFFTKLKSEWERITQQEVVYKYMTCHVNCHSNCHGSHRHRW